MAEDLMEIIEAAEGFGLRKALLRAWGVKWDSEDIEDWNMTGRDAELIRLIEQIRRRSSRGT